MKKIKPVFILILTTIFLASCSVTDKVVSGNLIQKRKYTKGYHINNNSKRTTFAKRNSDSEPNESLPENGSKNPISNTSEVSLENSCAIEIADNNISTAINVRIDINKKRPAYFDNTIRDRIEKHVGKSKKRFHKKLKRNLSHLSQLGKNEDSSQPDGYAVGSLIISLIAILYFTIFFGTMAVLFGIIGLIRIKKSGGILKGRGLAITGIVLGILDILALFFLAIFI